MKPNFKKPLFYILIILLIIIFKINITKYEKNTTALKKVNPNKEYVINSLNDKFKQRLNQKIKNKKISDLDLLKSEQANLFEDNEIEIREEKNREEEEESKKKDGPDKAFEQDFYRTMNLEIKRPTPELLPGIINENYIQFQSKVKPFVIPGSSSSAPWVELGPNNVGGRTRTITWDPNDPTGKKVWAGGVSGGLWYNNDITSSSSLWNKVDDFWQTLSINKIVFDPLDNKIAYVTTGEGFTSSSIGAGIWKTTNGGTSWTQLSATTNFLYSNDIVIRKENNKSVVYAAIDANYYMGKWTNLANVGLNRSTDNGATWKQTLPIIDSANTNKVPFVASSIQISKNNTIWVGTKESPFSNTNRGGGYILKSINGTDWTVMKKFKVNNGDGRVTIAVAPSNEKIIYAYVENENKLENLYKSDDEGVTWSTLSKPIDADDGIPATDFTRGQAWYNQSLAVDPNNPNIAIVGGIDLFKTIDGGKTWKQISKWWGWNAKYSYVHADQHAISYKPGSSNTVLFGNDGGVFYTTNVLGSDTLNVINARNYGYNVTQFYAGAIHPDIGKNFFLAGSQDNGTQKFESQSFSATKTVYGGDGAFCFIDQTNPRYQIASYVGNSYYLSTNTGVSFNTKLIAKTDLGSFINPATYDNILHILYSNSSKDYLVRIKNITGTPEIENVSVPNLKNAITALKVSPYNHMSTTLFLGTNNGKLLKVINADSIPSSTLISGASFPDGSISCIEIGASENELLVTFFNYGSKKIWYTSDGGKNWINKMGNFPDMPVRWALFNPNKISSQVILATELGLYATKNFETASPSWTQSNNGFANVRTDMMQLRSSDYAVIAATHGRGLFYNSSFSEAKPPVINSFTPKIATKGTKITIKGTNFLNASEVRFGGLPAVSFKVDADTLITAEVGMAYPGYVNVKTTGGIAALSGFSTNPPKLSSFSPQSGGNLIPITISGSNLSVITKVVIGGRTVKNFIIESSTRITTTIPDSTINGKVIISNEFYADSLAGFTTCATPKLSTVNDISFCDGNSLQISSSSSSQYQWLNNSINISNEISQSFKIVASGNYQVKTTNNSCSALSNPLKVTVNALPTTPIVKDISYCQGALNVNALTAEGTLGFSLKWYGNDASSGIASTTAPIPSVNMAGNKEYYVSQVSKDGCESARVKIKVVVKPTPSAPAITNSTPLTFCAGQNVVLTSNGVNNQWYLNGNAINNAINATWTVNTSGTYTVKANIGDCSSPLSSATTVIVNQIPSIPTITSESNGGLTSSASEGNQWYFNDLKIENANSNTYTPVKTGQYKVEVTNQCGNSRSLPINLIITSLEENNIEQLKVFPNPFNSSIKITFDKEFGKSVSVSFYDNKGSLILSKNSVSENELIDLSGFSDGTYLVIIKSLNNENFKTIKLIKN